MKADVIQLDDSYQIEEPESLTKLKLMTEGMAPSLDAFACTTSNVVEYEMDKGTAIAFGLWKQPNIAVSRTFFSGGSLFPEHSHNEKEYLIVYQGQLDVTVEGKIISVTSGDTITICPGQAHSAEAIGDTRLIAITIPAAEGFPEAS
jgi:quercetin dioxygenase-like cupin family protein